MITTYSQWRNNKTGTLYMVTAANVYNATNANDGQLLVLYIEQPKDEGHETRIFAREVNEFKSKFTEVE